MVSVPSIQSASVGRRAIVVGAGPAGLGSAACLARRGVEVTVLEAGPSLGTSWRNHYERLHLHTVKEHSGLPGFPWEREMPRYPSRQQVVEYLERYAAHFGIAPRCSEPATRISASGEELVVETAKATYRAPYVVVASGYNRTPNPEKLPGQEGYAGTLLHSSAYKNGAPFRGQRVLVVGVGNTGAEIALDLAEHGARPTLAVRTPVNVVPRDFLGMPMQKTSLRMRYLPVGVVDTIGKTVSRLVFGDLSRYGLGRPKLGPLRSIKVRGRIPLIDVGTVAAIKRGAIAVAPGVARFSDKGVVFADGRAEDFDAVLLCIGYRPGLTGLVEVPGAIDERGYPKDWRGGGAHPGLFFVGYEDVSTGLLREIALQAQAVGAAVAP